MSALRIVDWERMLGTILGVAAGALELGLGVGAGTMGSVFAAIGILGAATALGLAAQAGQARIQPAVAVGGPIIDFVLPDHAGASFHLATLRGRPFLLKFFRGHW